MRIFIALCLIATCAAEDIQNNMPIEGQRIINVLNAKIVELQKQAVKDLAKVQDAQTRSNKLDAALAVRDAITELESRTAPTIDALGNQPGAAANPQPVAIKAAAPLAGAAMNLDSIEAKAQAFWTAADRKVIKLAVATDQQDNIQPLKQRCIDSILKTTTSSDVYVYMRAMQILGDLAPNVWMWYKSMGNRAADMCSRVTADWIRAAPSQAILLDRVRAVSNCPLTGYESVVSTAIDGMAKDVPKYKSDPQEYASLLKSAIAVMPEGKARQALADKLHVLQDALKP